MIDDFAPFAHQFRGRIHQLSGAQLATVHGDSLPILAAIAVFRF
jgi:hypothetical protein